MTSPREPRRRWIDWLPTILGGVLIVLGAVSAIAGQLGWVGGWVSALGVLLIVVGGVLALWNKVAIPIRTHVDTKRDLTREAHEKLRSVVEVPPAPVCEIDPYDVGVFKSDLADRAANSGQPPYVPRDIDDLLDAAFDEKTLTYNQRLVVVRGDPKSGKSRTLWEALRRHEPSRMLVALRPPMTTEIQALAHKPIETLLDVGVNAPVEGLVFWIDDAQEHIGYGLTHNNLRRLIERYPTAVIALTVHNSALGAIKQFDEPMERLLRKASDALVLETKLSEDELGRARAQYPTLQQSKDLVWLPEWFAAVNLLRDRYRDNKTSEPIGTALVKAAIDWRRAGMPPAISTRDLRDLAAIALEETAPNRTINDQTFHAGLAWATDEVATRAALLLRSTEAGEPSYSAFDAVWSWVTVVDDPVSEECWKFVLDQVTVSTGLGVGFAAYLATRVEDAESVWRRILDSGLPDVAPPAAHNLGVLLREQGRLDDAASSFQSAIDSGHIESAPSSAYNLGSMLAERERWDEAAAAYQVAIDSEHPDHAPPAAYNLGTQLQQRGRFDEAAAAYQVAIDSDHPEAAPKSAYHLAILLGDTDPKEAEAAYAVALRSLDTDVSSRAANNLGLLLDEKDPERAAVAFQLAIDYGDADIAPAAACNLGILLEDEYPDEAAAAYQLAIDSGHSEHAPTAAYNLGLLLKDQHPEEAVVAYQVAIDSGHPEHGPLAAYNLGRLQQRLGKFAEAASAYRLAIDSDSPEIVPRAANNLAALLVGENTDEAARAFQLVVESGDSDIAPVAAYNLGFMLQQEGKLDDAMTAFRVTIDSGHSDLAPRAANNLGAILQQEGKLDDAVTAYRKAIKSGHRDHAPAAAYNLGFLLQQEGKLDDAVAAFRLAISSGHPVATPLAEYHLGLLLDDQDPDEAADVDRRSS